ncbi:hypothetical protein JW766_01570 [Candidatus Dojkabacteria bacterium]|nr:hypothetical protein [Candidatus Dojkabacteria bacterium]
MTRNQKTQNKRIDCKTTISSFLLTFFILLLVSGGVFAYANYKDTVAQKLIEGILVQVSAKETEKESSCFEYNQVTDGNLGLTYQLPSQAIKINEFPTHLKIYNIKDTRPKSLFKFDCNENNFFILIYNINASGLEMGYLDLQEDNLIKDEAGNLFNDNTKNYFWKENPGEEYKYSIITKNVYISDSSIVRFSIISSSVKDIDYNDVLEVITTDVQSTKKTTSSQQFYTNPTYGYTFNYTQRTLVEQPLATYCKEYKCLKNETPGDVLNINSLSVTSYTSNIVTDYDYDEGLHKDQYKEPQITFIGGIPYYYIITTDGYVKMLTHDFKYKGDTLWVKTERRVTNSQGTYYVSFTEGIWNNQISEEKIEEFDNLFKSFRF